MAARKKDNATFDRFKLTLPDEESVSVTEQEVNAVEEQNVSEVTEQDANTALAHYAKELTAQRANTFLEPAGPTPWEKKSVYFYPNQARKIEDLVYQYNRARGDRPKINQDDLLRHLVDEIGLEALLKVGVRSVRNRKR